MYNHIRSLLVSAIRSLPSTMHRLKIGLPPMEMEVWWSRGFVNDVFQEAKLLFDYPPKLHLLSYYTAF